MKNVKVAVVIDRAKGIFNGFTAGQRAVTIIAVVVALVGAVVFVNWAGKPAMAPLYTTPLTGTDASAVTAKLTETGTPYELADGGKTILVPSTSVDQARINLAGAGLPANSESGQGYGILKENGLGSSDFQQKLTAKRAYEGELAKAIAKIEKVREANVLLALPENSVYSDEAVKPSASVQVKMNSGAKLAAGQVDAIVHLVSSSIPKMEPTAVTVTDSAGTRYTDESGQVGGLDRNTDQVRAVSLAKTAVIQKFLDTIVGPGNSTVNVQADLDFDNTQINREEYIPIKPGDAPLTMKRTTEKMTGNGGQAIGGVLGPDNISVPNLTGGTSSNEYNKEDLTQQNPYGKQTTIKKVAQGAIKQLNVAIALDTKAAGSLNQATLTDLLGTAAAVNTTRGDKVVVAKLPFDTKAAEAAKAQAEADAAAAQKSELMGLAKNLGLIVLLLIALLIGFKKSRKTTEVVDLGELPSALPALPPGPANPPLEYQLDSDDFPIIEAVQVDPQSQARVLAREEIGTLVAEDPDEVARLLRGWIAERS